MKTRGAGLKSCDLDVGFFTWVMLFLLNFDPNLPILAYNVTKFKYALISVFYIIFIHEVIFHTKLI